MKNIKEALAKKRWLALYANLTIDDYTAVWEVHFHKFDEHYTPLPEGERREQPMTGWVRVSEPVEVGFSGLENDIVVRNAVASLDEQERELRAELGKKIAEIQERRNQLLALTHEVTL